MDGPPNAVMPRRKKEVNSCGIEGFGSVDMITRKYESYCLALFAVFLIHLLDLGWAGRVFFVQHFIYLQTTAATEIQCLAVKLFCDHIFRICFCAAMVAFDRIYHSITCPYENDGITFATANPRRMV